MNGVTHTFKLDGSKILAEEWDDGEITTLWDNEDNVCGIDYNSNIFYFLKNLQGDIIAITDESDDVVARYSYDAWGVPTIVSDDSGVNIATINPFRYRGYYYDSEIQMYYLQSRYYDPVVGRFVNADEAGVIVFSSDKIDNNLFNYCENSPTNHKDISGYIAANIVGAAIGAIIGAVGGVFLGNWLADVLKLSGWKRGIFVVAVAALVGAAAGAIGYFIGPYVAKIAVKLGQYIANLVRQGRIAIKNLSSSVKSSLQSLFKETCCFVAGTTISTPDGDVSIENISVGDYVYSTNLETGETAVKKVLRTFKKQTSVLYHVVTSNEEIITTQEHPFWVKGKGWVSANTLQKGDILSLQNQDTAEIVSVFVEKLKAPITVYNFEVEDWHTYFVGKLHVLVHNKCNWTVISDSYLKRKGFDAHSIKYEYLGKKANIKLYDLYYDKTTGAISIFLKKTKQLVEVTTYFIK